MTALAIEAHEESWELTKPVRIARQTYVAMDVIVVSVTDVQGRVGRGEAAGLPYEGETTASLLADLADVAPLLHAGTTTEDLLHLMPRGGARNALDCALWDLRCKSAGQRVWDLLGIDAPVPLTTALTLGIGDDEQAFRAALRSARHMPIIKLKVDKHNHLALVRIAREEHPSARLLVDANGSWDRALVERLVRPLSELGVELIEQPVAVGNDLSLKGFEGPIPLAADESCTDRASLSALENLYGYVNIKLDKTGGLTEALALARDARAAGFGLMVGNMGGTSLSMAAHFIVALGSDYVDLDAPLLCRSDRRNGLLYDGARVAPPVQSLWG